MLHIFYLYDLIKMELNKIGYLTNEGVYYPAILSETGKSSTVLQPFFEAFTNALEAITQKKDDITKEKIIVKIFYEPDLFDEKVINKIVIEDSGIGFNNDEFKRFLTFKDTRKGYHNRGSGRLQLIHSFATVEYFSVFMDGNKFKERKFHLSKSSPFLKENAIVYLDAYSDSASLNSYTTLTLKNLMVEKDKVIYNMTLANYKEEILNRYIQYFCARREALPIIQLESYKGNELDETLYINSSDIPSVDSTETFWLNYQSSHKGTYQQQEKEEQFKIEAFKISKDKLPKNILTLTSKGEIVQDKDFKLSLSSLSSDDHLDNQRFLFLISSPYINERDSDVRGQLRIPRRQENPSLFDEDIIFLEDIENAANDTVTIMYQEISNKVQEKTNRVTELKDMFLLNDDFIKNLNISINDTEEKILEKVYVHESKLAAKGDAELKKQFDHLIKLNPKANDYDENLNKIVNDLVKEIPHQNRAALTHFVARRKIVLELFDKVLKRGLEVQQAGRNEDEKLLHNILFTQRTNSTEQSDLWILNEDFILFKGVSEAELRNITIDGQKIFKEELTDREEAFINANNERRLNKRPDVLLFPSEEKCIILEFKTPNTNVSDHLADINYYASLILNLTKQEYPFKTFYGYLIGETLEPLDIKFKDSDFIDSAHFEYAFRPAKRILGEFKNFNGSLYTEVLKYSTLLDRANNRNEVLISKLFPPSVEDDVPF